MGIIFQRTGVILCRDYIAVVWGFYTARIGCIFSSADGKIPTCDHIGSWVIKGYSHNNTETNRTMENEM